MRQELLPKGICCSRCGGRFTREHPAKAWFLSHAPYWPIHRACPSGTLGLSGKGRTTNT